MKQTGDTARQNEAYPVSVLSITDSSALAFRIKRWLESCNCLVYWVDSSHRQLASTRQNYFDLIVLDARSLNIHHCELCQKLKSEVELAGIPVVMLARGHGVIDSGQGAEVEPTFHISTDACLKGALLQIVEEIRYMTLRYL